MRIVLRLILPGGELPGGELLAAPWALQATPLQFPRPPGGELLAAPWALQAPPFQSSRKTKAAERKVTKAIKGMLLSIRSRSATVIHAATTSVAQIEFAASQKRHTVTKLDENEGDEPIKIRPAPASGAKLLMYRLTLVATLIVVLASSERIRFSLQAITKSSAER
jgi:hypothetical protein